ncbi:MAG: hypothetical protein QF440_04325 [Candidatus Thalassarchaeaceae archaeon]|jgi:hypothetical protein|nr:hypothetical protein [Candidatus Thalassarchaeaceae archaeon]
MRLTRKSRRRQRLINRAKTIEALQTIANDIQAAFDNREITHNEAVILGNQIQRCADLIDGTQLVYAISDRDAYRRLIEVYLDDGILSRTEQILLWDERRKLGISEDAHTRLLVALIARYQRQGRPVHVQNAPRSIPKSGADENTGGSN